jgi:hypothetical protein
MVSQLVGDRQHHSDPVQDFSPFLPSNYKIRDTMIAD